MNNKKYQNRNHKINKMLNNKIKIKNKSTRKSISHLNLNFLVFLIINPTMKESNNKNNKRSINILIFKSNNNLLYHSSRNHQSQRNNDNYQSLNKFLFRNKKWLSPNNSSNSHHCPYHKTHSHLSHKTKAIMMDKILFLRIRL